MFVHEPIETNRQAKQRETDKLIEGKLGSRNIFEIFFVFFMLQYSANFFGL